MQNIFFSYVNALMQYLPILISLFLQSPIGGQPRLLLSSSSRYSNGSAGPLTLSLYKGSKRLKKSSSNTNTWKLQKDFCILSQRFKRQKYIQKSFYFTYISYLPPKSNTRSNWSPCLQWWSICISCLVAASYSTFP